MNAAIVKASSPVLSNEESVSFPFLNADITRYGVIEVEFVGFDGHRKKVQMEGFQAFGFQQAWDYSVGLHMLDWRLHHGTLRVQDDVREKLPKTTSVLEQYSRELKAMRHKYPKLAEIPPKMSTEE